MSRRSIYIIFQAIGRKMEIVKIENVALIKAYQFSTRMIIYDFYVYL